MSINNTFVLFFYLKKKYSTNFHIITGSGKAKEDKLAFNAFYHDLATKIMDDEKIMTSFRVLLGIPYFTAQL